VACMLPLAGCLNIGPLGGRARDESTKTYPLSAGGEVRIVNTNGRVEVQGVDGSSVEVRTVRDAKATTDEAARQLLPRIGIHEEATPDRVSLETDRIGGLLIGAGFEVQYYVKAPRGAVVNVTTTNGSVSVADLSGSVRARTTNGGISAKDLVGAVEARSTNGGVHVDVARVGAGRIALSTTNGGLTLALPEDAKADVSATWTNGGISVTGLNVDVSEHGRRRFDGRMNGGGTPVELRTTNGGIQLRARATAEADER